MKFGQLKRREFIKFLGGPTAWPLAARTAAGDAGGWVPQQRIVAGVCAYVAAFPQFL
jgi:hypothetical protein